MSIGATESTNAELLRQYRLLSQSLSMHATLRDRYRRWALILDVVNLGAAVVFCATTFASDATFEELGVSANSGRIVLGVAAVASFFVSIVDLRVDWKGKASQHKEAADKLADVHRLFRTEQLADGEWDGNDRKRLTDAFLEAVNSIENIPEKLFITLKAKHLRKVAVSKLLDEYPTCPVWVLRTMVCLRAVRMMGTGRGTRQDR